MLQRKPACTGETMKANSLRPADERKINTINLSKSIRWEALKSPPQLDLPSFAFQTSALES
ncbi:hypothetical protein PGT21_034541 [Puccinia graminis f. sp. tritici]|uniref:Uncharacterized protein n=1 Tax=Puccinia graminis f. sp. tritici TaxID=56615 RepID=A0A5B0PPT8_PUCGR|nr:hypothetical protein PGT21_034541 [Puccinia graminis f. sp. tritici]